MTTSKPFRGGLQSGGQEWRRVISVSGGAFCCSGAASAGVKPAGARLVKVRGWIRLKLTPGRLATTALRQRLTCERLPASRNEPSQDKQIGAGVLSESCITGRP